MRVSRQDLEHMIVYEDEAVIVCHKCPYLAVESANVRQQDLVSLLKNRRLSKRDKWNNTIIMIQLIFSF